MKKKEHPGFVPSTPVDEKNEKGEDHVWNYHMSRLQIGLYFLNLEDAIQTWRWIQATSLF